MGLHARRQCHVREGIGDGGAGADLLLDQFIDARYGGAAAGEHDMVDVVVLARREEKLQRTAHLLGHRLLEGVEHLGSVVVGEAALLLRHARFLVGEAVAALDLLGELFAAEHLFARIDLKKKKKHKKQKQKNTNNGDGEGLARAFIRQLCAEQAEG